MSSDQFPERGWPNGDCLDVLLEGIEQVALVIYNYSDRSGAITAFAALDQLQEGVNECNKLHNKLNLMNQHRAHQYSCILNRTSSAIHSMHRPLWKLLEQGSSFDALAPTAKRAAVQGMQELGVLLPELRKLRYWQIIAMHENRRTLSGKKYYEEYADWKYGLIRGYMSKVIETTSEAPVTGLGVLSDISTVAASECAFVAEVLNHKEHAQHVMQQMKINEAAFIKLVHDLECKTQHGHQVLHSHYEVFKFLRGKMDEIITRNKERNANAFITFQAQEYNIASLTSSGVAGV